MKTTEACRQIGEVLTLLEMDNMFSVMDNNSMFSCDEGRKAIEKLIRDGKSDFSYIEDNENERFDSDGYCVYFELVNKEPASPGFADCSNTKVRITDVWQH